MAERNIPPAQVSANLKLKPELRPRPPRGRPRFRFSENLNMEVMNNGIETKA